MGYEHREDAFGGGKAGNGKHTHTHTVTHVGVAPQIKLMSYKHREDAVEGGGSRQWQRHTNTHTHTYTHSVPRETQDGWSLGQGSDLILTNLSVAPPLIKFVGNEHQEDAVGGGGSRQ